MSDLSPNVLMFYFRPMVARQQSAPTLVFRCVCRCYNLLYHHLMLLYQKWRELHRFFDELSTKGHFKCNHQQPFFYNRYFFDKSAPDDWAIWASLLFLTPRARCWTSMCLKALTSQSPGSSQPEVGTTISYIHIASEF